MKTARELLAYVVLISFLGSLLFATTAAGKHLPTKDGPDKDGYIDVHWTKPDDRLYVFIPVPGDGRISWQWTTNRAPHPDYEKFEDTNDYDKNKGTGVSTKWYNIYIPNDDTITDVAATKIYTGSIDPNVIVKVSVATRDPNTGKMGPLRRISLLQQAEMPVLSCDDPNVTIHNAVELTGYLAHNPHGFAAGDWAPNQYMSELGVVIEDGKVDGLEGIYWATTPFDYDPCSTTGWVPQGGESGWLDSAAFEAEHGPIFILDAWLMKVPADINDDGAVDMLDFKEVADNWLQGTQ